MEHAEFEMVSRDRNRHIETEFGTGSGLRLHLQGKDKNSNAGILFRALYTTTGLSITVGQLIRLLYLCSHYKLFPTKPFSYSRLRGSNLDRHQNYHLPRPMGWYSAKPGSEAIVIWISLRSRVSLVEELNFDGAPYFYRYDNFLSALET